LFSKDSLVIGCGNPLLGDDGFGPAVIKFFDEKQILPNHIGLFDAGTSVRDLLFDMLLSGKIPGQLIFIDAVQKTHTAPGEIIQINIDQIPANKVVDYSLHQFPTTNMLKQLQDSSPVDIRIYAVQVDHIPQMICPGLSRPVKKAIKKMVNIIMREALSLEPQSC